MLSELGIVAVTLFAAVVASAAQYIFKTNVPKFGLNAREIAYIMTHPRTLTGLGVYAVSLALYLYALSNAPIISFVYPIFASTFVFILLISKFGLNERINLHRVLGMLMILAGIAVVAMTFPV